MSRLSAMAREQSTNYKHYYRERLRMVYNIRIDNNEFERVNYSHIQYARKALWCLSL